MSKKEGKKNSKIPLLFPLEIFGNVIVLNGKNIWES